MLLRLCLAWCVLGAVGCGATASLESGDGGLGADVPSSNGGGAATLAPPSTGGGAMVGGACPNSPSSEPTQRTLVTLASGQDYPYAITVDSENVYWSTFGTYGSNDGTVMKVSVDGGAPVQLASHQGAPGSIGVDATSIYWSTAALMKVSKGGGTPVVLANGISNDPIAVGPKGVYGFGSVNGQTSLVSVPLDGGTPTALVPSNVLAPSFESYGIVADASYVYWTNFMEPCPMMKVSLAGGNPQTLATVPGAGGAIALDATDVYFATSQGVYRVPLEGGDVATLAQGPNGPGIAVDDNNVYFTDGDNILRISKCGTNLTTLATGQATTSALAVDSDSVYWVTSGSVMKLTPK